VNILRRNLPRFREAYQVQNFGLFGSRVRREERPESDLDILVTFRETPGLLKLIALENELTDLLGVKVDLVMEDGLKPWIAERIKDEVIPV
jgi:predicted nucleotidyltransferase